MMSTASSRLKKYAKIARLFGWLSLIFYSLQSAVEFLTIVVNPKYQSALMRGDWRAWIEPPMYVGGIFLRGWIYWFLFIGLSTGLLILNEIALVQRTRNNLTLPEYYHPKDVLWVSRWLDRMAIIGVIASILMSVPSVLELKGTIFSFQLVDSVSWGIWLVVSASALSLQAGVIYLGLRSFAQILKVVMEIEKNYRQ